MSDHEQTLEPTPRSGPGHVTRLMHFLFGGIDPRARRRVRSAAWQIGSTAAVSNEIDASDLAKLALVRLLWLQRQTRRAYRTGNREAAILLSRASLETGVAGCYCQAVPGAAVRYEAAIGQSMRTLMGDLVDEVVSPKRLGDLLATEFGKGREPNFRDMAAAIEETEPPGLFGELDRRFYAPLSNLYLHASPTALVRHVSVRSKSVKQRATPMWSARSAANLADAMVALLAGRLTAEPGESEMFDSYFRSHFSRSLPPRTYVVMQLLRGQVSLKSASQAWAILRRARAMSTQRPLPAEELDDLFSEATAVFAGGEANDVIAALVAEAKSTLLTTD